MAKAFDGKWVYVEGSQQNFEELMTAMGISDPDVRKMYGSTYTMVVSIKEGVINTEYELEGYDQKPSYQNKIGEWQELKGPAGEMYMYKPTVNGNVITEESDPTSGKPGTISTRTLEGDIMTTIVKVKDDKGTTMSYKLRREK